MLRKIKLRKTSLAAECSTGGHDTTGGVMGKEMTAKGTMTKGASRWHQALFALLLLPLLAHAEPGFWHASKGDKHFWIMGSIHVGKEEFYPLPAAIEQAWQKADVLVMEADMRNSTPNEEAAVGSMSRLPAGTSLKQQLPPELYRRTVTQAKKYGLPEQALANLRPWVVAITLTQQAIASAGYQADLGVDEHFAAQAMRTGMPVRGLERVPEQLAYIANMGAPLEQDFLDATIKQIDTMNDEIPRLMNAWFNGDGTILSNILRDEQGSAALQEYMERRLIKERNHNWLPKLLAMPEKNRFVVVGALHLYGPDGLLALLRQQGYQVEVVTKAHE